MCITECVLTSYQIISLTMEYFSKVSIFLLVNVLYVFRDLCHIKLIQKWVLFGKELSCAGKNKCLILVEHVSKLGIHIFAFMVTSRHSKRTRADKMWLESMDISQWTNLRRSQYKD